MDRIASDLGDILVAVEVRAADALDIDRGLAFTSLRSDEEIARVAPSGDLFVTVHPGDFPINPGLAAGAGQEAIDTEGTVTVALWVNLSLDEADRDAQWLRDASLGALAKWRKLLAAFHVRDLQNPTNTAHLLYEPMRCTRWSNRPRIVQPSWGKLEATFETKFLQTLS